MFDPVEYWKRRKDGKRGQGEPLKPVKVDDAKQGEHMVRMGGKLVMVNRKTARQKQSSHRIFTKAWRKETKQILAKERAVAQRKAKRKEKANGKRSNS